MSIKIDIDQEECSQCGLCYNDECPEVFEEAEEELSQIVKKYRTHSHLEGEVPDELEDCVRRAADICPTDAIYIG